MNRAFGQSLGLCLAALLLISSQTSYGARPVVPGTGTWIDYVGDDFEDTSWDFIHNHPKSSREQDERLRSPTGRSTNGRWFEGPERGHPDLMQLVETPAGGLEGSNYALLVRTLKSGIPGRHSFGVEQDDLIVNCASRLNGTIPVSETPNFVARVYLPPWDEWENRSGPHFGIRGTAKSQVTRAREKTSTGGLFRRSQSRMVTATEWESYWPGIWIHFRSETSRNVEKDSAFLKVRGNGRGRDFEVRELEVYGWWTFGMSFTPDGMVHYYASPGVDDLTSADYLTSQYPYSYRAQRFSTLFFDICNRDDGKTWSTPFVIDDTRLYLVNAQRVNSIVIRKQENAARQAAKRQQQKTASKPTQKRGR